MRVIASSAAAASGLLLASTTSAFTAPIHNAVSHSTTTTSQTTTALSMGLKTSILSLGTKAIAKATENPVTTAAIGTAVVGTAAVKLILDRPSRTYSADSVAREYDAWTSDGILEYYWGEHIHLGYYNEEEMAAGYKKKNFIQAKYDFIDEMMKLGKIDPSTDSGATVLDVGCGFGGTSRYLADKLGPKAEVTGITLSPNQVKRGTELAKERGLDNAKFMVMNALEMDFPDDSFDIVWACESGEHMPDKEAYINEMMRVLKPGGKFVMATWCQRDDREVPFDKKEKRDLRFLYEEWTHPYFISIEAYEELIDATKIMGPVVTADWNTPTIASWRHSIWVGVYDPRGFIFKPTKYLKCARDAYCLERMHRAFDRGLMEYGMFAAQKPLKKED